MNTTFNLELNGKPGRNGLHEVFLRITQERKHKRIKLGISVKKADFNKKADYGKWIRQSNPEYASLKNKYPLVFIDRSVKLKDGVTVTTDNGAAAAELTEKCIEGGADRFVIMFEECNSAGLERLTGAQKALSAKKIPYLVLDNPVKTDASFLKSGRTAIMASSTFSIYAFYEHNKQAFAVKPPLDFAQPAPSYRYLPMDFSWSFSRAKKLAAQ